MISRVVPNRLISKRLLPSLSTTSNTTVIFPPENVTVPGDVAILMGIAAVAEPLKVVVPGVLVMTSLTPDVPPLNVALPGGVVVWSATVAPPENVVVPAGDCMICVPPVDAFPLKVTNPEVVFTTSWTVGAALLNVTSPELLFTTSCIVGAGPLKVTDPTGGVTTS
jgi:hypothetical protein